jgi:hypothetical protein
MDGRTDDLNTVGEVKFMRGVEQRTLTEGEGSVQLTSSYILV